MSNTAQIDQEEPKRLMFKRDHNEESYAWASLGPYPEAYCLGDQELLARFHAIKNDEWPDYYKFSYICKVTNYVEYGPDNWNFTDNINVNAELMIKLTESKIKDYDNAFWSVAIKK